MPGGPDRRVVVAHPSPDVYGSDLQLLESITGFVDAGWSVLVVLPRTGPLVPLLDERGAQVRIVPFPVLSKSLLSPRRLPGLAVATVGSVLRLRRMLRTHGADALWVNTLTVPSWLVAGRLARVSSACHVHEAEESPAWLLRVALAAPLLLAGTVVVNSRAAARSLLDVLPPLRRRTTLVYNGVPGPAGPSPLAERAEDEPWHVALVGRLSPRKGTDVALEAVALLRSDGLDVRLELYGTPFSGYEWFEEQLRSRASQPDLAGAVTFHGYVNPVWAAVAAADVVVVPSRTEPFGNVAVEAMLVGRPVVASRVQGLAEIVEDGSSGLLVDPGDAAGLAGALRTLRQDPASARRLAAAATQRARELFGVDRYRRDMARVLEATLRHSAPRADA